MHTALLISLNRCRSDRLHLTRKVLLLYEIINKIYLLTTRILNLYILDYNSSNQIFTNLLFVYPIGPPEGSKILTSFCLLTGK